MIRLELIRLELSARQVRQVQAGADCIHLDRQQERELRSQLARAGGAGRPPVLAECRYCGVLLGGRARRAHEPKCRTGEGKASKRGRG
jgi:hypothetical protein